MIWAALQKSISSCKSGDFTTTKQTMCKLKHRYLLNIPFALKSQRTTSV